MKWPAWIKLVRHDVSEYNKLREKKRASPLYRQFLDARRKNIESEETRALAILVWKEFCLGVGDADTDLADSEGLRAYKTGETLSKTCERPDVIFVSPYKRARLTLKHITRGWPALEGVKIHKDERVREQEHGIALIYNDWKVFEILHSEQRMLRKLEGPYWYRYPQGENVPDVRTRNRSWLTTLTRDFPEKKIFVVTHHLNILATRANLERLDAEEFVRLDETEKPINCGVTTYSGYPDMGQDGRLMLQHYNLNLYD